MTGERTERDLNEILNRARESLAVLSRENPVDSFVVLDEHQNTTNFSESVVSSSQPTDETSISLNLELGRTVLSTVEVARLGVHSVIPLSGRNPDFVQLYCGDTLVAEGTLLVTEGLLTVRIERVVHGADG